MVGFTSFFKDPDIPKRLLGKPLQSNPPPPPPPNFGTAVFSGGFWNGGVSEIEGRPLS